MTQRQPNLILKEFQELLRTRRLLDLKIRTMKTQYFRILHTYFPTIAPREDPVVDVQIPETKPTPPNTTFI